MNSQPAPETTPAPSLPATVLLIVLVAAAAGTGIALLTGAHQLGACVVGVALAVALIVLVDQRLRRHGAARRAALNSQNTPESNDG